MTGFFNSPRRTIRHAAADDYEEPLRGKILRGEVPIPDEYVLEERWPVDEAPFHVLPPRDAAD